MRYDPIKDMLVIYKIKGQSETMFQRSTQNIDDVNENLKQTIS